MSLLKVTRRDLLIAGLVGGGAGATGLYLGFWYGERRERWIKRVPDREQAFSPNVYLAVDSSGEITIWLMKSEMGQGVMTAWAMIIAEELEADWDRVRVVQAIGNDNFGDMLTGVSSSVRENWQQLRQAGAAAREMLIAAAALAWKVEASTCRAEKSFVIHEATGRRIGYGALAGSAAKLPVPHDPPLKARAEFRILERPVARLDIPAKVDGSANFGMDVRLPGMMFATVLRSPVFGGRVKRFDATRALAIAGVRDVFQIPSGLAVVGDGTWPVFEGRRVLERGQAIKARSEPGASAPAGDRAAMVPDVEWDEGPNAGLSSEAIDAQLMALVEAPGVVARAEGNVTAETERVIEADYRVPFLAHATMEPPNCTVRIEGGRCEIWMPNQNPQKMQGIAHAITGLPKTDVIVRTPFVGGGFGRRVQEDELLDALAIAQHTGRPIQLVWPREEDIQHDGYRPAAVHRLRATLDADGWPVTWLHRNASPSISAQDPRVVDLIDPVAVEGAFELPYAIPNLKIEYAQAKLPVPLGHWRSVGHSFNAFAIECFVDELARAANKDPADYRRRLLAGSPRHLGVLELALEKARWDTAPEPGVFRGLAVHASFGSFVAMVAEISIDPGQAVQDRSDRGGGTPAGGQDAVAELGRPRVRRVVVAVDCGMHVNPDTIAALMEGGVVFGLTAALYGEITLKDGRVQQSNFHDYPMLRIDEMPTVETHIVQSEEAPGGIGEVAVPPIGPAVANALFAATGQPVRRLPIRAG